MFRRNRFVTMVVLCLVMFTILFYGCDPEDPNNGGNDCTVCNNKPCTCGTTGGEVLIAGFTFSQEEVSTGANSTITVTSVTENGNPAVNISGTSYNWAEALGVPCDATLNAMKTMKAISFWVKGDGNTYEIYFSTTDTGNTEAGWSNYRANFITDNTPQKITIYIPNEINQPVWTNPVTGKKDFIQENILFIAIGPVSFVNHDRSFDLTFWDFQLHSNGITSYIAGSYFDNDNLIPFYLKNGIKTDLSLPANISGEETAGQITSITESNGSIYITGLYFENSLDEPNLTICNWKDGVRTDYSIEPLEGLRFNRINSVIFAGGSTHLIASYGEDRWNNRTVFYWKDGVRTDLLSSKEIEVSYITEINGSIYILGYRITDEDNRFICYWKDGVLNEFQVNYDPRPSSINFINNSVYITGYYRDTITGRDRACYWKDGVKTDLSTQENHYSYAYSIIESGGSIYIVGSENSHIDSDRAVYWKDGVKTVLPVPQGRASFADNIIEHNGSIYIVGAYREGNNEDSNLKVCYWRNGMRADIVTMEGRFLIAGMAVIPD